MHEAQNFAQRLARLMAGGDDIGDGDSARVDERIARNTALALELHDLNGLPDGSADARHR